MAPTLQVFASTLTAAGIPDALEWITANAGDPLNYFWLGCQPYRPVWALQQALHAARCESLQNDIVLLLEHEPVYTFGKNADHNHLLDSHPDDADIVQIDRGGDITYHGPGQLVGYPILDLHDYHLSVSWYMRTLEQVVIDTLAGIGITAGMKEELIGVWVGDEKICALGVRLARWVSMHGFALNVDPDMRYFEGMIPCGIFEYGVTSVQRLVSGPHCVKSLAELLVPEFHQHFQNTTPFGS